MSESVSVRCPACRREHLYAAPTYPCVCGVPVHPPLDTTGTATAVTHQVWDEQWLAVRCPACGRRDEWPRPELGCPCGTILRVPVTGPGPTTETGSPDATAEPRPAGTTAEALPSGSATEVPSPTTANTGPSGAPADARPPDTTADAPPPGTTADEPPPTTTDTRPPGAPAAPVRVPRALQPVTIRTARDAVTAAALYLRSLGYQNIRRADQRPPSGIGLAARGLLAQVDPAIRPASLRDVECLWLTAMTESAACVYFSLAGYTAAARARADGLDIPLFVLDLSGVPQPVNAPAGRLDATGA
ncbi:hypothetical protein ACGFNV_40010 [Streptomyces sp. NPDC048751]|uniref:hypothetical protein n=1 Tax=Streptomyces sp. NPDC048751 TaxID=3365591 RepID=UPI003713D674